MPGAGTVEIDQVKWLVVVGRPVWVERRSVGMPLLVCSEVVPGLVEIEAAVPRLSPAVR
jgi:hypothetical protein